ncbi:MAG: hypothetical protein HY057_05420 [Rhodospirillales bacterium]|nr:hypothetical protein [Rhodospirillales bacterium]
MSAAASIKTTAGGVTTANFPQAAKKRRRASIFAFVFADGVLSVIASFRVIYTE